MMRRGYVTLSALLVAGLAASLPPARAAGSDVKVSDRTYVRADGGTDAVLAACSVNNRQQNEPAAAVAPHAPALMTAGANDYCTSPTTGGIWAGFYSSADRGRTWTNSLVPGYPGDTSDAGRSSPLQRLGLTAAGDPVQAWDDDGHVYHGGIAFNFSRPASGSIWVARYSWSSGPAPTYEFTTLVSRGTPSPLFRGVFEDKVQLEVDRGATSPHAGNVYLCWARFTGGATNAVHVASSSDGGRTFRVQRVSDAVHSSQFCDIAVTRDGDVHVVWRQYAWDAERGQKQDNAVAWVRSTDGGQSFSRPTVAAPFTAWDPGDRTSSASAYGETKYSACLVGDGTIGSCASPDPRVHARDCGDGPVACTSGYVFSRANTQVRVTADPTAAGDPDEVFVVFDATVPGTQVGTGTTYGTAGDGIGSQAAVYLVRTGDSGATWSPPARIDPQPRGHQFFPDVVAEAGRLHAVWQDSRADPAEGPGGGDFRTVPVANRAVTTDPPGAVSTGVGVDTFYATSGDAGRTWAVRKVSSAPTNPQYEQFSFRDAPFFGDYNHISASGPTVLMTWTDQRDTVPGDDPRYPVDGVDGFDVLQCLQQRADGSYRDTCPNAGGLDQNVYGAVVSD